MVFITSVHYYVFITMQKLEIFVYQMYDNDMYNTKRLICIVQNIPTLESKL